jgi:sugar diacid utilization regulator
MWTFAQDLTITVRAPALKAATQIRALVRKLRTLHRSGDGVLQAYTQVCGLAATVIAGDGTLLTGPPVELPDDARLDLPVPHQVVAGDTTVVLQPVRTKALRGGDVWLVSVVPSTAESWRDAVADLLAVLEPSVAAWLVDERLTAEQNSRFRTRLLTELMSGGNSTSQKIAQQAVAAGWQLLGWHSGFFIGMPDAGPGGARRDIVLTQSERVRKALQSVRLSAHVVELQDGWAGWTTGAHEREVVAKAEFVNLLEQALAHLPSSWRAYVGVGRPHGGISGLAATLGEARDAANLARTQPPGHRITHIDDLGAARIMTAVRQSPDAITHANSLLSPLRHVNDGLLLDTLRVYLDNRSSLGLTAEALNLHRNTVSGRLTRIRQLLGVDLDDPEERLALSLACRIAEAEG